MVNFKDRERVGFRRDMYTEIEGGGRLAQIQERLRRMDPESRVVNQLEMYYHQVSNLYDDFSNDAFLDKIIELFRKVPNKFFKNTNAFILGFICIQELRKNIRRPVIVEFIQDLITRTNQNQTITVSDAIRYMRLIESLSF